MSKNVETSKSKLATIILGIIGGLSVAVMIVVIIISSNSNDSNYLYFSSNKVSFYFEDTIDLDDIEVLTNLPKNSLRFSVGNIAVIDGKKIKANKLGSTKLKVDAEFDGKTYSSSIALEVKINPESNYFDVKASFGKSFAAIKNLNLYVLGGDNDAKLQANRDGYFDSCNIIVDGAENISLYSSDNFIVINDNKVIASSAGECSLTVVDKDTNLYSILTVNVYYVVPSEIEFSGIYSDTLYYDIGGQFFLPEANFVPAYVSNIFRTPEIQVGNRSIIDYDLTIIDYGITSVALIYGDFIKVLTVCATSLADELYAEVSLPFEDGFGVIEFALFKNGVRTGGLPMIVIVEGDEGSISFEFGFSTIEFTFDPLESYIIKLMIAGAEHLSKTFVI